MPSNRASKRLQKLPPEEAPEPELPAKRTPKPNSNSLESFSAKQPPIARKAKAKKPTPSIDQTPANSTKKETPPTP